jgi:quinoprotein glucose dehydrogenase
MRRPLSPVLALLGAVGFAAGGASVVAQRGATPEGEWPYYSGDLGATKYSPLAQINQDNVKSLRVAWRRPSTDPAATAGIDGFRANPSFRSTPLMLRGVLYVSNGVGLLEAMDPETGKTLWMQRPLESEGGKLQGTANRGVSHWTDGAERRLLSIRGQYLYALNPEDGEPYGGFGDGGKVDLTPGLSPLLTRFAWSSPPLVLRDVIVVGSQLPDQDRAIRKEGPPGDVRGFDVRTGRHLWTFHVIPREGEPGVETWEDGSWTYTGGGNVWAPMSADEELGYVYLPTTSPTNDGYGGHRRGDNLYTTAIVCLEAKTGRRIWHHQLVRHNLWDYDNPAAPILADITVDGRRIKAVVQVTKQAFAFVFDRATGKPVWPIEERPVPQSAVPGEKTAATQPFPTKPPAFDRQGISIDDLIDFTPQLRAEALEIVKPFVIGPMFTPPTIHGEGPNDKKGTIVMPGLVGGANWPGASLDPETGILYVPSMTNPVVADLMKGNPENSNLQYRYGPIRTGTNEGMVQGLITGPRGLPLLKPPYGRITAIDLNRGEPAWMVPNGEGPRHHPALESLNLPPLGQASQAAPLVTKTLLFVSEGDQVNVRTPPDGGGRKLRAYDKRDGRVLWETDLSAGTTGMLMTYTHRGKQYLVAPIGGATHQPELVAFSLP